MFLFIVLKIIWEDDFFKDLIVVIVGEDNRCEYICKHVRTLIAQTRVYLKDKESPHFLRRSWDDMSKSDVGLFHTVDKTVIAITVAVQNGDLTHN